MCRPFILLAALALSCTASQRARTEGAVANAFLSDADETAIGRQIFDRLQVATASQPALRFSTDPTVTGYVESLFARLTAAAQDDRDGTWAVHVIDNPNAVSAFSTPGGHVYLTSGLLLNADNEAEVVGVLGHELGHLVAQHPSREMVSAYGLRSVNDLALARNEALLQQIAAAIKANNTFLAHGRSEEYRADEYAVRYSAIANYEPAAISGFFEKLLARQASRPADTSLTWLLTHPAARERASNVADLIASQGLIGTETGADRLAPIRDRIRAGRPVSSR